MKTFKQFISEAKVKSKRKSSFLDKALVGSLVLGAASGGTVLGKLAQNMQRRSNAIVSPMQTTNSRPMSTPRVVSNPVQAAPKVVSNPVKAAPKVVSNPVQAAPQKTYHHDAIKKMVIQDEGIKLKPYKDTKGLMTVGIGHNLTAKNSEASFVRAFGENGKSLRSSVMKGQSLTKDQARKLFDTDYEEHLQRTIKMIPDLHKHPADVQSALVSGVYRGDVTDSPTFRRHFNAGDYESAHKEYLNRQEYRDPVTRRKAPGVITRLERNATIFGNYAKSLRK